MRIPMNLPGGSTMLALLPLALLAIALMAYALVLLGRAASAPYLPKWVWVVVIVISVPWGALAYLIVRGRTPAGDDPPAPAVQAVPAPARSPARAVRAGPKDSVLVATTPLTRDYGAGAGLFDVELRVPDGAIYGLVGPNGAGKSTVLSILSGVRRADRGEVRIGVPRTAVAVCPDVPEFEPWLTAAEVVDLARHYVAPQLGSGAVRDALAATGLDDVAGRRVGTFSRGMTQRLGLAAALVGDPRLLLLDEPTAALDPAGRAEILDLVGRMRGRRTVIFSSHILADVQRVADVVGVLRAGRLLYQGSTRALIDEHLQPTWSIRVAGQTDRVADAFRTQPWIVHVDVADHDRITVSADTVQHGEQGIPRLLASCGAGLIACEPLAADLESAFLALTAGRPASAPAGPPVLERKP